MTSLLRHLPKHRSKTTKTLVFILLLLNSTCQPVPATATIAEPSPTNIPTVALTSTNPANTLSPTPIPATEVPQITATEIEFPLSTDGPWLAYRYSEGLVILNQDGTGRTSISSDCNASNIQENASNRLLVFSNKVYLFQPTQATLVYSDWPSCSSDFTGDEEKGLLASIYRPAETEFPELRIYELPSGKVRDQLPLFHCDEQNESCNPGNIDWGAVAERKWSPNGRYLAFSAALDGSSSDLYMYDAQSQKVLRLTTGPDSVSQIWWSPDGRWIIMGELHENVYPFTTSVWAVSANNNEIRKLYSIEGGSLSGGYPQGILGWLDNNRFITFWGTSLKNALDLPAYHLNLVDIESRTVTPLYRGSFFTADLISDPGIIVLGVYEAAEPGPDYQGGGTYLVSVSNPALRFVGPDLFQPDWNDELQLFITDEPCENDASGKRTFNNNLEWQCVHPPLLQVTTSPDGQWRVGIDGGTYVWSQNQDMRKIHESNATQAIWRPDSQGFFFVADHILYYYSVPDLSLKTIDEYLGEDQINYHWIE